MPSELTVHKHHGLFACHATLTVLRQNVAC